MTIAADCRHVDSSGIGVYIRECLPFFLNSGHHFLLLGDSAKLKNLSAGYENTEIIDCGIKPFSPAELFFFPKKIISKINRCDCFYSSFFNIPGGIRIPVYTTIHDIVFPDMPELTGRAGLAARMWFYRRAFSRSKKIFTVSEFSKSRIERHLGTGKPVKVTHSAIQPWILKQHGVLPKEKNETIIFAGNIKKHKGLDCLVQAFLLAKKEGLPHKLIIIGNRDNFRTGDNQILKTIDSLDTGDVIFTGFISNEKLGEYFSSAALLVQPSLYEGFGLPPLEAMVMGTAALVSDIPVFREIYAGYPVVFFKAGDSTDLKNKLMTMLFNKKPVTLSLSPELASKYTFEKTAGKILRELELD